MSMSNLKIRERLKEIKQIKRAILKDEAVAEEESILQASDKPHGISLIIPVHRGEDFIKTLVNSLNKQSLDQRYYEVIFIFNGDYKESESLLETLNKEFVYQILYSERGVGRARNVGINNAKYAYISFLDVDDTLSEDYLKHSLEEAEPFTILLNQLHEIVDNRDDHGNNVINKELNKNNQYPNHYFDVGKNLSLNGAKVIPTNFLLHSQFNEHLNNGEDVALYAEIVTVFKPIIKINQETAIYFRYKGQGTLSRTKVSFQFNVLDRIHVIDDMQNLLRYEDDLDVRNLLIDRMRSQALFINKYLVEHIEDYSKVIDLIRLKQDEFYPYQQVNKDLAETLYVSYCFPPFVDTSGIVMAKRINQNKEPVDVVHNDMTAVRAMDPSLEIIADPYIDTRHMIHTPSSFSSAVHIQAFVEKALKRTDLTKYKKIYSRALWPGSHMAAFYMKEEASNVTWHAEFSDPILYDIKNQERKGSYFTIKEVEKLKKKAPDAYSKYFDTNLYNMCEVLPFVFADEIIFTNNNQAETMLDRFDEDFKNMVREKATISSHPSLDEYYYNIEKNYVNLNHQVFNIGYFGNFYETRSATDIIRIAKGIKELNFDARLYIFTNDTSKVRSQVITEGLSDIVFVESYLKYFEFLNAAKEFDCLILSDANTKAYKDKNPYLPSKYSDYKASGTQIWALYEEGSPLNDLSLNEEVIQLKSELGNEDEISEVLKTLMKNV